MKKYIALCLALVMLISCFAACGEEKIPDGVMIRYWNLDPLRVHNYNDHFESYDIRIEDSDTEDKFYFVNGDGKEEHRFTLENMGFLFARHFDGRVVTGTEYKTVHDEKNRMSSESRIFRLDLETGECTFPEGFDTAQSHEITCQGDILLIKAHVDDRMKLIKYDLDSGNVTEMADYDYKVSKRNISHLTLVDDTLFYTISNQYLWRVAPDENGVYGEPQSIKEIGRDVKDIILHDGGLLAVAVYRVDTTKNEGLSFWKVGKDGSAVQAALIEELDHPGTWYDIELDGSDIVCTTSNCCSEEHHEYRVSID